MKPAPSNAESGPSDSPNDSTSPQLRHDGPCGIREQCWRPSCRLEFGDYLTVERWPDTGVIFARCHGIAFEVLGMQAKDVVDADICSPAPLAEPRHLRAVA